MPFVFGTNSNDTFGPSNSSDIFITLGGADVIETGGGNDRVFAGNGADTIIMGGGTNIVFGGGGADTFQFKGNASGTTFIRDFQNGTDVIDVSALGIQDISQLNITASGNGSLISINGLSIFVNVAPGTLDATDFVFDVVPTQTVDFEDLSAPNGSLEPLPSNYAGFTWTNFGLMEYDEFQLESDSGYRPASGDNLAYNQYGDAASIARGSDFDLESVAMSAAWNEGLQVTLSGYNNGALTGTETFTLAYGVSQVFELNDAIFDNVDEVVFTASGGTDVTTDSGAGTHFALDDLIYA